MMMKQLMLAACLVINHGAESFVTPPSVPANSRIAGTRKIHAEEGANAAEVVPDEFPSQVDGEVVALEESIVVEVVAEVVRQADAEVRGDGDVSDVNDDQKEQATELKRQLYALAASYDRGFGATPGARDEADGIIRRLAAMNPTEGAARGIDGGAEDAPLKAIWRMVWTTAFDVVSLGASPFAAPSAIYQDISDPPVAVNIIDFIPRAQAAFPASLAPPSLLRAEVATRAVPRNGESDRVGLIFEGLKLQPIELLGKKVDGLPPLSVDFSGPRNLIEPLAQFVPGLEALGLAKDGENADADAPGYFDVEYVDDELLIIRQNAPGGVFALVKVDNCDP